MLPKKHAPNSVVLPETPRRRREIAENARLIIKNREIDSQKSHTTPLGQKDWIKPVPFGKLEMAVFASGRNHLDLCCSTSIHNSRQFLAVVYKTNESEREFASSVKTVTYSLKIGSGLSSPRHATKFNCDHNINYLNVIVRSVVEH